MKNIKTTLEAVAEGSSYNFSIDEVHRVDGPFFAYLDDVGGADTVVFIEEGQTSWTVDTHDGKWLAVLEVFIGVARRYEPDAESPLTSTIAKSTIRSKLVADVMSALLADDNRGGFASRGFRLTEDGPQNLDDIVDGEGGPVWELVPWVAHELRFEMAMIVDEASP